MSDDAIFRALADPSRRELLDRLRERDGRTSHDLCRGMSISRQAVAKHLSILEAAKLVSTRWKGREKLHFLSAAPIADAAEGWMKRFERSLPPLTSLARRPDEGAGEEAIHKPSAGDGTVGRPVPGSLRRLMAAHDASGEDVDDEVAPASRPVAIRPGAPTSVSPRMDSSARRDLRSLRKTLDEEER